MENTVSVDVYIQLARCIDSLHPSIIPVQDVSMPTVNIELDATLPPQYKCVVSLLVGMAQTFLGLASVMIFIALIVLQPWGYQSGTGVWTGAYFALTGASAILVYRHRKVMLIAACGVGNLFGTVLAVVALIVYGIAAQTSKESLDQNLHATFCPEKCQIQRHELTTSFSMYLVLVPLTVAQLCSGPGQVYVLARLLWRSGRFIDDEEAGVEMEGNANPTFEETPIDGSA